MNLDPPTLASVRSAYTRLCRAARQRFGGSLAGRFVLCPPLSGGTSTVLASGITGAASLTIEPATDAVREATRTGIVDFAVNTLDEALRILKNEIRKQQAVSVLLEAGISQVLAEAAERGAQPDLIAWPQSDDPQSDDPRLAPFLARGAVLLPAFVEEEDRRGRVLVSWRILEPSAQVLRRLDALALNALPEDDLERRHWITRAPRYLPRALRTERSLPMSREEEQRFRSATEHALAAGELPSGIEIQIDHNPS